MGFNPLQTSSMKCRGMANYCCEIGNSRGEELIFFSSLALGRRTRMPVTGMAYGQPYFIMGIQYLLVCGGQHDGKYRALRYFAFDIYGTAQGIHLGLDQIKAQPFPPRKHY